MPDFILFPVMFILSVIPAACIFAAIIMAKRGKRITAAVLATSWLTLLSVCIGLYTYGFEVTGHPDGLLGMVVITLVVNFLAIIVGLAAIFA